MGSQGTDQVSLGDVPVPFVLTDLVSIFEANGEGVIRGKTIHHHDFVAPAHALQAAPDLRFAPRSERAQHRSPYFQ